jgi:hypothetical protein
MAEIISNKDAWAKGNIEIAYSSELTFLGLFITKNSAWHVQIHSLCSSLSKGCYEYPYVMEYLLSHSQSMELYFGQRW